MQEERGSTRGLQEPGTVDSRGAQTIGGYNWGMEISFDLLLIAGSATALLLAACTEPEPIAATTRAPTVQPNSAGVETPRVSEEVQSNGAELYAASCQVCHGDREGQGATGGTPPHNETGHTWHHPDAQLKDWVLNGKFPGTMPPFKDVLRGEEVHAILSYIKTWWTAEQRESQADISQRYQEALDKRQQRQ